MMRTTCFLLSGLVSLVIAHGQETAVTAASQAALQPTTSPAVRFSGIDVYVDPGDQPLAAYQLELTASEGQVKIVGIEGGEHPAFANPPYYDPAAMMKERVILAAFNTGNDLPTGRTRVARIHVQISGDAPPQYELKLTVAASSDGERIAAAGVSID